MSVRPFDSLISALGPAWADMRAMGAASMPITARDANDRPVALAVLVVDTDLADILLAALEAYDNDIEPEVILDALRAFAPKDGAK